MTPPHDPTLIPHAGTDGPRAPTVIERGQYLLFRGQSKREKGEVLAYLRVHRWRMHQSRTMDEAGRPQCPWQSN